MREWGSVGLIAVVAAHLWGSCSGQNVGFDNNGNCPVGHTLCVLDEPLVSLGGVPRLSGEQPPQAAGATACAFTEDPSVNGTFLYFANTPYANLQVFASYDDGASWAHSRDIDLPCNPRGLAIDDTAADPYALFACTETGQVFSVSLATGTSQLLSSGIDFSPGFRRGASEYSPLPGGAVLEVPAATGVVVPEDTNGTAPENAAAALENATTAVQCSVRSSLLTVGIVLDAARERAWLSNRNWDELLEIDLRYNASSAPRVCSAPSGPCDLYGAAPGQPRPPAAFCAGECVLQHHCCNYRAALRSDALRMPTGGSLARNGSVIALGSGFPAGKVYLVDVSGVDPVLAGELAAGLNGSAAGVHTPAFHPGGRALYMASRDDGWLAKVSLSARGVQQGAARLARGNLARPVSTCFSPDGRLLGLGLDAGSAVLGSAACNFVDACRACPFVPPGNASFGVANTCDWFCAAGHLWVPSGPQDLDARSDLYSQSAWITPDSPGRCEPCELGRYAPPATVVPREGAECLPCPGGTRGTAAGLASLAGCARCPGGYFSPPGSTECTACPGGTFGALSGVAECALCPAGSANAHAAATNSSACAPCPPGQFANGTGLDSCASCSEGKVADAAGVPPARKRRPPPPPSLPRPARTENTSARAHPRRPRAGASACQDCPAGRWSTAGNESCHILLEVP